MKLSLDLIEDQGNGLVIPENTTLPKWTELMKGLSQVKAQYHACLADAISFGKRKWPDQADNIIDQLEFPFADIRRAEMLALTPSAERTLPAEIYHVAGTEVKEPAERDVWLKTAEEQGLSPRELQHSIRMGRVVRQEELDQLNGKDSSIPTLTPVVTAFQKWLRHMGGTAEIAKLPDENKAMILTQLTEIYDLCWGIDPNLEQPS